MIRPAIVFSAWLPPQAAWVRSAGDEATLPDTCSLLRAAEGLAQPAALITHATGQLSTRGNQALPGAASAAAAALLSLSANGSNMHANSSANLSASTDLPHWGGMAPIDPTAELMSFAELPRWQRWLPTAWGEWYAQLVVPIWMRFVLLAIFCGICCISDMIPLALSGLCLYGAYGAVWFLWRRLYVVKRGFIWLVGLPELLLSERVVCVLLLYVLLISQLNLECQGVVRREHGHDVRYPLLYLTGAQLLYGGVLACLVPHYVAPSTALLQAATLFSAALLGHTALYSAVAEVRASALADACKRLTADGERLENCQRFMAKYRCAEGWESLRGSWMENCIENND